MLPSGVGILDPVEFYGGIKNVTRGGSGQFLSEIATGSYVGWQVVKMKSDGGVGIYHNPQLVDFQFLSKTLEDRVVTNTQSWAVGDIEVTWMIIEDCRRADASAVNPSWHRIATCLCRSRDADHACAQQGLRIKLRLTHDDLLAVARVRLTGREPECSTSGNVERD